MGTRRKRLRVKGFECTRGEVKIVWRMFQSRRTRGWRAERKTPHYSYSSIFEAAVEVGTFPMYTYKYGPKHTLMYSWCELGYDYYLFFVGKGVLCCCRLASCTYSRRCNGVAFNTENTLFRWPTNWQSCGVITEIRFYTKWSSSRQQLCMLRQMLEISRYSVLTLSFRVFFLIVWTTSERKTPVFETFRDETLAIYSKNHHRCAALRAFWIVSFPS